MGEEEQELEEELSEGGFMELLSSGDLLEGEEEGSYFSCSSSSSASSSLLLAATQMVHFGLNGVGAPPQNSSADSSATNLSSSPSSASTVTTTAAAGSSKASRRAERGAGRAAAAAATAAVTGMSKKPKREGYAATGTIKVRKEKLGDRIMALQQLVSPFGKSDTASVLHEALGYIRFLHDQVQVLSSPYLQHLPPSAPLQGGGEASRASDLRSRGLCLVPISCTEHVADGNGADFWSPSTGCGHLNSKH